MRILNTIIFSFLLCIGIMAQEIKVLSFKQNPMDLSASTHPRYDINNDAGALVKVLLAESNVKFEGDIIGTPEFKANEYWVYVTAGTKFLKIKAPNAIPLQVSFADNKLSPAQSKMTYELALAFNGYGSSVGKRLTDSYKLGLNGNVESIEEVSNYYEIRNKKDSLLISSGEETGLFDGNAFLSLVFGDEHGARIPYNYLLFYSTNLTFQFNQMGNVDLLMSNAKERGVISFFYDKDNNLIKQDAHNNINRNQNNGIIEYNGNQMTKGQDMYKQERLKTGDIRVTKNSEPLGVISFDENNRVKRIYLPSYWRQNDAEYLFEYNSKGWPSKIISRTGKKGHGQIITKFSYLEEDMRKNWIRRIAEVDWRYGDENTSIKVETHRNIIYRQ